MTYRFNSLEELTEHFRSLPGIGGKSAQRLAFHVLNMSDRDAKAFAEAEGYRAQAMAEAQEMQAKGYTQKDVLQADVQKSYADALGQMGANGGGGGVTGDIVGLGVGLAAAGSISAQMGDMFKGYP